MLKIKPCLYTFSTILTLLLSNIASAGWYVGLDATNLSYKVEFTNSKETYNLNPKRLKLGYIAESGVGIELQGFGSAEANTIDAFGDDFKTELGNSFALVALLSGEKNKVGWYGSLGIASLDTTYIDVANNVKDLADVSTFVIGLGSYYRISNNFKVTLDYTHFSGHAAYRTYGPNNVDVNMKGFGLGLNYMF